LSISSFRNMGKKKTTNKNKGGSSMIKTCYLLKEKLTDDIRVFFRM